MSNSGEKKPVAAVKPQIQHSTTKKLIDVSNFKENSPIKKQAQKNLFVDDSCPSCNIKYELTKGSQHRKVFDVCDHDLCFSCLMKGKECPKCNSNQYVKENSLKSTGLSEYLDGIEDIFDDDNEQVKLTSQEPIKRAPSPPVVVPKPSVLVQPKKRECVVVDSDDDLIIEVDEEMFNEESKRVQEQKANQSKYTEDIEEDEELISLLNSAAPTINSHIKTTKSEFSDILIPDINSYEKIQWLFNDIKDCSSMYRGTDYPHTQNMFEAFRNLFGLKAFRAQQFEAVNAAMLGHNCFILVILVFLVTISLKNYSKI